MNFLSSFYPSGVQFRANVQDAEWISSLSVNSFESVLLHGDNHIKIESVIGFPEAQNEEEAEQTRPGKAPVEPRQLCKTRTRSCKHSCVTSRTPPIGREQASLHSKALNDKLTLEGLALAFNKQRESGV